MGSCLCFRSYGTAVSIVVYTVVITVFVIFAMYEGNMMRVFDDTRQILEKDSR